MKHLRSDKELVQAVNTRHSIPNSDGLTYVRINQNGKVIAVFDDNSEMDVSELFTLSIMDD